MQTKDIINISAQSPYYLDDFKHLNPRPKELHALGNIDLLHNPNILAVVGSRRMTRFGKVVTTDIARITSAHNIVIVSGLAFGVDYTAQHAALERGGQVIAVLPGGLDTIYPREHTAFAQKILDGNGLLMSEYAVGVKAYKHHFIARNRLIAAIAHRVVVPQAAYKSGSLHTVRFAQDLSKDILAVPGDIYNEYQKGSNALLRDGAHVITSPEDILNFYSITQQTSLQLVVNDRHGQIIAAHLHRQPLSTNQLINETGLSAQTITTALTMLEINSVIESIDGGLWKLRK